jgi:hypothetical protein
MIFLTYPNIPPGPTGGAKLEHQHQWKYRRGKVLCHPEGKKQDPERYIFDGVCHLNGEVYLIYIKKQDKEAD